MKVNEAPTKIYLDEDESWHLTNPNGMEIIYSSFAEGFVFNGWRYFLLGIDSYEQFYY
jgi:hypothetical protein